jgi:hypothetical protein
MVAALDSRDIRVRLTILHLVNIGAYHEVAEIMCAELAKRGQSD